MNKDFIIRLEALTFPVNWQELHRCPICDGKDMDHAEGCPIAEVYYQWGESKYQGKTLHCCGCNIHVTPRLTCGAEVYPRRADLRGLPFWRCDGCGNFVGCHHKTKNPTQPLGCIPTKEIKTARQYIHRELDPLWKTGLIGRVALYKEISERTGRRYHTAHIRSVEEARKIYAVVKSISKRLKLELSKQEQNHVR